MSQQQPLPGSPDVNLPLINCNAAGIDIGADTHWVSVPVGRDSENVRSERLFYSSSICNGRLAEAMQD
jgi:hypothetical protein